jgi:copper chaperone CopZ
LETALKDVKGVKEVKSHQFEKRLEVHYLESQTPLSKLAHALSAAEPLHGENYVGVLALKVEGLTPDNLPKAQEALAKIKGVNKPALDTKDKTRVLTVTFNNKGEVKLTQLLDALKAAGFKAEAYLIPAKE